MLRPRRKVIYTVAVIAVASLAAFAMQERHAPAAPAETKSAPSASAAEQKTDSGQPIIKDVLLSAPFTSQAPDGDWSDPIFEDGCEEASLVMAHAWMEGENLESAAAKLQISEMAEYEKKTRGNSTDTSAADTAVLFNEYYKTNRALARLDISNADILQELAAGNLVIVPANGRLLGNPYYTPPGPDRHMLVVIGYNTAKAEYITNDAGTRRGQGYRYGAQLLYGAIRDYPSGNHLPIEGIEKNMIVIKSN